MDLSNLAGKLDMSISIKNYQKIFNIDLTRIRRSLKKLVKELNCLDREICLLIVDDNYIKNLNAYYLHRDYPTNVMSFTLSDGEFGNINPQILGDIVISVETAHRDAVAGNIDFMDEMEFLMIHGLLHLVGYNHENTNTEKTSQMMTLERKLFFLLRHYHLDCE
jgi:probable rRNA maturation factor